MNYTGKPNETTKDTATKLNDLLCSYNVHYQKLRAFHWNVTGPHFFQLHAFFEEKYNESKKDIDDIAERILVLQYMPISSMKEYLEFSMIEETSDITHPHKMVENILSDTATLIKQCRETLKESGKIDDEGTADLIGGVLARLEKNTWMLEAWKSTLYADVYEKHNMS